MIMSSKSQLKTINEIIDIEGMTAINYKLVNEVGCVILLQRNEIQVPCSNCGRLSRNLHQNHSLTIRDLSMGEHHVYLRINRRQMNCRICEKKFSEEFDFVQKKSLFTNRFKHKIVEETLNSDIKNVAERYGLSEQEVETIIKEAGSALICKIPENLKRLGLDEIAFVKGQKNYCAVLVDLDTNQLIAILPKRTQEEIRKCLESWGTEVLSQIAEVSIDLFKSYKSLAEELMPNAQVVADRFHVMKQINEELDKERRKIKREIDKIEDKDEKEKKLEAITYSRYALLKNERNLNELQKEKLIEIKEVFPELSKMHEMKELFRDIFETENDWLSGLFSIIEWMKKAQMTFPQSFGTIGRWIGEIIAYFDNRTTQGAVEGVNNKLKLIKRRGYGFRNFDNFQIRCMLAWHFNH
jgi:transposase